MRRRDLLGVAAASLAISRASGARDERADFLVIVAGDMRWADVGRCGSNDVRTPAIDS